LRGDNKTFSGLLFLSSLDDHLSTFLAILNAFIGASGLKERMLFAFCRPFFGFFLGGEGGLNF